jgi:hypothetical protein
MGVSKAFLAAITLAFFAVVAAWSVFRRIAAFVLLTGFVVFVAVLFPIVLAIVTPVLLFEIIAPWISARVRRGSIGGTLAQFLKASFSVTLALGTLAAIAAPWLLAVLTLGVLGDQQRFEGGGFREWLFSKLTLTGRSGQLEPDGRPASYYIRFQRGTAAQAASMEYVSRRPAAGAVAMFRVFCLGKRLIPSEVKENAGSGELEIMCLPPGETYQGKFESSYLYLVATPAETGSRVTVGEMDMDKY